MVAMNPQDITETCGRIPYSAEQGILRTEQGIQLEGSGNRSGGTGKPSGRESEAPFLVGPVEGQPGTNEGFEGKLERLRPGDDRLLDA